MYHPPANNPPLRVAIATLAYNEEEFIGAVIRNWKGKVAKHVVFLSSEPWHGMALPPDRTEEIARALGAEVVKMKWVSETAQRNYAAGYLRDFDYVLVVDADELYTEADQLKILESLGTKADEDFVDNVHAYRAARVRTYFKTADYVLDPPDSHEPLVAMNPKHVSYADCRIPTTQYQIPLDITMHHVSYLRNDLRLYHEFKQFEHYDQVKDRWFETTWRNWTPEDENVRAFGREVSKAVPGEMPEEIKSLIYSHIPDPVALTAAASAH